MRIAISAEECSFTSDISMKCARCHFFIIHDFDSGSTEFIPNPNKDMNEDAGKATVELLRTKGVKKIISGDFGVQVKSLFDSLHIQMIVVRKTDFHAGDLIDLIGKSLNIKNQK